MRSDSSEKTLDPGSGTDWDALRKLGHRMVDEIFAHLQGRREQPVWQRPTDKARKALGEAGVPREGEGAAAAYEDFLKHVLPYGVGNRGHAGRDAGCRNESQRWRL